MKIIGNPNEHIIDYDKGKEMFCLDGKGEFETKESMLILWVRENKPHLKVEESIEQSEESLSDGLTYHEMKKLAAEKGINTQGMTKEEIEEALKAGD